MLALLDSTGGIRRHAGTNDDRDGALQTPFHAGGADGKLLPPGPYLVETEEKQILGLSFIAYRRVHTTITVPTAAFGSVTARRVVAIEPAELEAALAREAEPE